MNMRRLGFFPKQDLPSKSLKSAPRAVQIAPRQERYPPFYDHLSEKGVANHFEANIVSS